MKRFLSCSSAARRGEKLEGNEAVELQILGFVDDAHSPFAKLLEDLVVADVLADHMIRIEV